MFRARAHHQEVRIVLYSLWYHHTETSEWSKITKIQFYKYEHIVVKFMCEFFGCDYCVLLTNYAPYTSEDKLINNSMKWYRNISMNYPESQSRFRTVR